MIEKMRRFVLGSHKENPASRSSQLKPIDPATLDSLYRLSRLLMVDDAAATDLIGRVYRKAAVCGHLSEDSAEQKIHLFKHLHFLFQQDSEKRSHIGRVSEMNRHRSSDPTSVLNLIRQQEPIARLLIFLRHCEGLSLHQISSITGQEPIAIHSLLLEFRSSLRRFLENSALQPTADWSKLNRMQSSQLRHSATGR
jgi:DNA-directed RNA polymerase specialized sigma24 family protein